MLSADFIPNRMVTANASLPLFIASGEIDKCFCLSETHTNLLHTSTRSVTICDTAG